MIPARAHIERHFTANKTIEDIILGISDGLTVPFALAAGLSGAVGTTSTIVIAGLAEVTAGCISMGLGGYLAGKSEEEHYYNEQQREKEELITKPLAEKKEIETILTSYGIPQEASKGVAVAISRNPRAWIDFMMRFELGLEKPDEHRARLSGLTIGLSYVVGGMIPLSPYFFWSQVHQALLLSVLITLTALFIFGFIKSHFTGVNPVKGGFQFVLTGGIAAFIAFYIARLIA